MLLPHGAWMNLCIYCDARKEDSMERVMKVRNWRDASKKAANMAGFDNSNKTGTDANFVEKVVKDILTKLNRKSSPDLKGLVGLEWKIEQIERLLCIDSPNVCTVGIWGMGGICKTTLADVVYHRLSSEFEASCFLANVRDESEKHGLKHLRNVLLREILNEKDLTIGTPSIGSTYVRERLSNTKVLVVLDDFGSGSRIIITTRDRRLLKKKVDDDKIYKRILFARWDLSYCYAFIFWALTSSRVASLVAEDAFGLPCLVSRDDFFGVFLSCGLRLDRLSNKLSQPPSYNTRSNQAKNNRKSKNSKNA
ncbi:unnamed protein product [Prunus armeniaca]